MQAHINPAASSLRSISFSIRMGVCGVLTDIATAAQLSGLHAVMLIALAARLMRIPQCEKECAKLEACARKLHALLNMATQQHPAVVGLVAGALAEAAGLVGSYRGDTFWSRVRNGKSMETRLRDMRSRLDCLCMLVLYVHANLLTASHTFDTTNHHVSDPSQGAETSDTSDNQRYNSVIVQGGANDQPDNNEPGGFESV